MEFIQESSQVDLFYRGDALQTWEPSCAIFSGLHFAEIDVLSITPEWYGSCSRNFTFGFIFWRPSVPGKKDILLEFIHETSERLHYGYEKKDSRCYLRFVCPSAWRKGHVVLGLTVLLFLLKWSWLSFLWGRLCGFPCGSKLKFCISICVLEKNSIVKEPGSHDPYDIIHLLLNLAWWSRKGHPCTVDTFLVDCCSAFFEKLNVVLRLGWPTWTAG